MARSATHQLTLQQNELQQLVARDSYKAELEAAQSANQQLSLLIAFLRSELDLWRTRAGGMEPGQRQTTF